MNSKVTYKPFGDSALLIEWPDKLEQDILADMLALNDVLQDQESILETVQSVNSITVMFDSGSSSFEQVKALVQDLRGNLESNNKRCVTTWKLPVCYDPAFGLDIEELAEHAGLTQEEVVRVHSAVIYTIQAIGFLPGFPYLSGLDKRLHMDRKAQPRMNIEKGAVGIGGSQTGIYPSPSPGGWQIIGNCPVTLFDPKLEVPCFAEPGDRIQFHSVTLDEHQSISTQIQDGTYHLEKEVSDD